MFYHASPMPNLSVLTPHASNHEQKLVYFSTKRENVLVYLSNAVEKFCKEAGFVHTGPFHTWASYGFTKDGVLTLEEYYPNATWDTYKGVSGYIYSADEIGDYWALSDIPFAVTTEHPVTVTHIEYISDAYETIQAAAQKGDIILQQYTDASPAKLHWIEKTIRREFSQTADHPDYQLFLKAKFDFLR